MSDLPLEVTCGDTKRRLDAGEELMLLDCREENEFAIGVIAGAVLLPMSQLQARVGELAPHRDAPIVVYCHHGMRSAQVANWLRAQGFSAVQSMAGGIDQWSEAIDPGVPRY